MIKAIDFFSGAGGLTRGLLDAGIQVQAGIDIDNRLRMTYETNNYPSRFICRDIKSIDIKRLRRDLKITKKDTTLYAACCPCQPFSTLNRMKGLDPRKNLLISFADLVQQAPPDCIVVENVPGLNTAYGKDIYERFIDMIAKAGFKDHYAGFLDAKDFGVPQVRKRFILLAVRGSKPEAPLPETQLQTVENFIKKYPPIRDGEDSKACLNHVSRPLKPHHRVIVQAVPKDGGSRKDIADTSILLPCHQRNPKAHKDVFGRMAWKGQAPTLTARCVEVYCGRFIHPDQDRGISVREAAALQTFPDNYEFFGSVFHIARQIGNAVPVKFAEKLGEAITRSM